MTDKIQICGKCGFRAGNSAAACPQCGQAFRDGKVRGLGWLQLIVGIFLLALMGTVTYNLAPGLLQPGAADADGSRFTGSSEQATLILGLFGLILMFGLFSVISGLWQIVTGRKNKWIFYIGIVLVVMLFLMLWSVRSALGG